MFDAMLTRRGINRSAWLTTRNFNFVDLDAGFFSWRSDAFAGDSYEEVFEDFDFMQASAAKGLEDAPSLGALAWARVLTGSLLSLFPAPEVTARDSGTVLLLWYQGDAFLSVEIGDDRFGLMASRPGAPSIRLNAANVELVHQFLPSSYSPEGIATPAKNPWGVHDWNGPFATGIPSPWMVSWSHSALTPVAGVSPG